ncbi:hypothetical protein PHLCEN_2v4457 [Hermanssonia centrifuga]|uniref:Nephrocystin 3-like N-terminal domain-containing protein n=1 Tax=Hermanssonia centrifuga TaxID=98765 RepID=A0A2R6PNH5_9APHY|nr:hypothetical protein PHLCEN_2v4457 [Hermanssonia centrifuga]
MSTPFEFNASYKEILRDSLHQESNIRHYRRNEELYGIKRPITITVKFSLRQFTTTEVHFLSASEDNVNPRDIINIVQGIQTTLGVIGEDFESALDIVGAVGGVLANVHPIVSLVVAAMSIPIKYYKKKIEFKDSLQKLAMEAHRLLQHLGQLELDDTPLNDFDILESAVVNIMEAIVEAGDFVQCYMARGNIGQTVTAQFSEAIQDLLEAFRRCREDFQLALSQKTHRAQSQKTLKKELREWLGLVMQERLEEECMEGTRKGILSSIDRSLDDPASYLIWIHGAPGIGKSTIVSSIIHQRTHKGDQVFTFRFKRRTDYPEPLRDPGMLWPSLAFDLAQSFRDCRLALIEAKKANPRGVAGVTKQFKTLIQGPIRNHLSAFRNCPRKLLVVIDGVDEATRDPPYWVELLDTLREFCQLSKESGGQLRVVISSRTLHDISAALSPLQPIRITLSVADSYSDNSEIWHDLHHFFTQHLRTEASKAHPRKWPRDEELRKLTEHANGLFLWADNAVRYILRPDGDKQRRLDFVLTHGYPGENNVKAPSALDLCYSKALQDSLGNREGSEKSLLMNFTRAVVISQVSLSIDDLVKLGVLPLGIDLSDLRTRLGCLLPFVEVIDSIRHFRAFHDSFRIFLVSERARKCHRFNESEENARQALYCLKWMNKPDTLYFNLFSIPSSYDATDDVDLGMVFGSKISPLLDYTCRFWTIHLTKATFNLNKGFPATIRQICKDLVDQLDVFFHCHFLHWLEVMSFLRLTNTVPEMIEDCLSWINLQPSPNQKLVKFVEDSHAFASIFAYPISRSIPHIYVSCLPFTSQESEIFRHFSSTFSNILHVPDISEKAVTRADHRGAPVTQKECVIALAFSLDGKSILSVSADCKSSMWDSRSGEMRKQIPLCGDDIVFATVASFSPDQRYIALGCIGTANSIHVYESPHSPHRIAKVELLSQKVIKCLVFFPPGSHLLACGYYEQVETKKDCYAWSIRILDYETGKMTPPAIRCSHAKPLSSLTISPDSRYIMACSADSITSFTFDSDNRLFYQYCLTDAFRLWDARTGRAITEPFAALFRKGEPMARDLEVAPAMNRVSSIGAPVYVADATFKEKTLLQNAPRNLVFAAHSAHKKLIASGGQDNRIYVWNTETGILLSTLTTMQTSGVHRCLAFSKDGAFIATGSGKGDITLWAVPEGQDTARSILPTFPVSRPAMLEVGNGQGGASGISSARSSRHSSLSRLGSRRPSPSPRSQASRGLDGKRMIWYDDYISVDSSGWIRDKSQSLLFWIPPEYRDEIRVLLPAGSSRTGIDFSNFMHGKYWIECQTLRD